MVNLQKSGDSAVKIVFTDSDHYLYGNGEIEVPVNSLLLVIDESDMVTFKKISGDPFLSFRADNSNLGTKAAIEQFYKENMVGSTGGGGDVTIDPTLDSGSTNPVANSAITTALDAKQDKLSDVVYSIETKDRYSSNHNVLYKTYKDHRFDYNVTGYFEFGNINGKSVLKPDGNESTSWGGDFELVEKSAITSSITSGSTDAEIPTAKAVYDATQSGGGGMDDDTQQLISTAFNDLNDRKADLTELSKYQKKGDYVKTPTLADYMTNASFDEYATAKERIISGALNDLDNRMIAVESGGSVTIDPTLDTGSTNPVANSAITNVLSAYYYARKSNNSVYNNPFGKKSSNGCVGFSLKFSNIANPNDSSTGGLWVSKINNKEIIGTDYSAPNSNTFNLSLVETSAITTSMTSSSTDAQVPSAKAVYDQFGGLKLVKLTQAEYDALATKDSSTLYIISD